MKKSSMIIISIVAILTVFIGYQYWRESEEKEISDAVKFREEYESLNNQVNPANNKTYPTIEISSNNVVKYSTYEEVLEILKTGTGVIYLGYPDCPWCRNLVPSLLRASEEVGIGTIYYLNIKSDRDLLMLNEEKNIITEKEGSKNYFKLMDALNEILDDYVLTSVDGEEVNTGEKRIYVPLVIFVKNGKIEGYHVDTVETQEDPYIPLNDRQNEQLLMLLIEHMMKVSDIVCDEHC